MSSNFSADHSDCDSSDLWFDRALCPDPCGSMHTICLDCGYIFGGCPNVPGPPAEEHARAAAVIEQFIFDHMGIPWTALDIADALLNHGLIEKDKK